MPDLKFTGPREVFRAAIEKIDPKGTWSEGHSGASVYVTPAGAVVNWWPKTGTITVQGKADAKADMRAAIESWLTAPSATHATAEPKPGRWHTLEVIVKFRQLE